MRRNSPAQKPKGKEQTGLEQERAAQPLHVLWQHTSATWLPSGALLMPETASSEVWSCRHLWAPPSTPKPCRAFGQGAGSSVLTMMDLLSGHTADWKMLRVIGFSQCLFGEGEGGRNTRLKHPPSSSGPVLSCCKVGCWSSERNPTDILKQIGLVGVATKMSELPNPPQREKQRASSLLVPHFPHRNARRLGLPSRWLPNCSQITTLYLLLGQHSLCPKESDVHQKCGHVATG